MDALEAIRTRRSVRKMDSRIPDRELIEQVIEAGRCAPSGSNSRSTHMLVITDRAVLRDLAEKVRTGLAGAGVPFDPKPFNPHITLVRKPLIPGEIRLSGIAVPPAETVVEEVCLYRSFRGENGMVYSVIRSGQAE